jgi:transposase InsO family protein
LAIVPHRRYSAQEKALILESVQQARERSGRPVEEILAQLGLPAATYYRWKSRAQEGRLADRLVVPRRQVLLPTPEEMAAVCAFALAHPQMGYKRLTWQMVDENVVCLRPYQVYRILGEHNLLCRRQAPPPQPLKRPQEPDHPDEVWHIDLMYLYIPPRWYYLVDILDSYSRFLVHWSLNLTMHAETVTLTVQEALERLPERPHAGEPKLVHDRGSQFLSAEWRAFVAGAGVTDIKTRVAHPESNGRLERLHRTHREEGLSEEDLSVYYKALDAMAGWSDYYNYQRPHSALKYLRPIDYYRGDPEARLAERERKLAQATEARKAYWTGICGC